MLVSSGLGERLALRPRLAPNHGAASPGQPRRAARRRLLVAIAAAGIATGAGSEEKREALSRFHLFDKNRDSTVDLDEYLSGTRKALSLVSSRERAKALEFSESLFRHGDIDKDGALSVRELEYADWLHTQAMHQAATGVEEFSLAHVEAQIAEYDANGDGMVDQGEWEKAMRENLARDWSLERYLDVPRVGQWLGEVFSKSDVDGDGVLGPAEVQYGAFLSSTDLGDQSFKEMALANDLIEALDLDFDGELTLAEIKRGVQDLMEGAGKRGEHEKEGKSVVELAFELFGDSDTNFNEVLDKWEVLALASRLYAEGRI